MYKLKRQLVDAVHKRKWKGPEEGGGAMKNNPPKKRELLEDWKKEKQNGTFGTYFQWVPRNVLDLKKKMVGSSYY